MDPNACLREILYLRDRVFSSIVHTEEEELEFLKKVEDLRHWLAMGGFRPEGLTSGPDAIPGDIWEQIQNEAKSLNSSY
jgi:hypothetical protein